MPASPPASTSQLAAICVKRKALAEWHAQPWFAAAVTGALVLLNAGDGTYQLRRIQRVTTNHLQTAAPLESYDIQKGVTSQVRAPPARPRRPSPPRGLHAAFPCPW